MQELPPEPGLQKTDRRIRQRRYLVLRGSYKEDIYIMGGILFYCGILIPALVTLGVPDIFLRVAWIAFSITLSCTIGFFLILFVRQAKSDTSYGGLHSMMALLAEMGIAITTGFIFYHVWDFVGWVFFISSGVIFLVYEYNRTVVIGDKKGTNDTSHAGEHHE